MSDFGFISEVEQKLLVIALGMGQATFTEEDFEKVLVQANSARSSEFMYKMVLSASALVSVIDGEVCFRLPSDSERVELLARMAQCEPKIETIANEFRDKYAVNK